MTRWTEKKWRGNNCYVTLYVMWYDGIWWNTLGCDITILQDMPSHVYKSSHITLFHAVWCDNKWCRVIIMSCHITPCLAFTCPVLPSPIPSYPPSFDSTSYPKNTEYLFFCFLLLHLLLSFHLNFSSFFTFSHPKIFFFSFLKIPISPSRFLLLFSITPLIALYHIFIVFHVVLMFSCKY